MNIEEVIREVHLIKKKEKKKLFLVLGSAEVD